MKRTLVVAVTGASGSAYAARLVEVLLRADCHVHVTVSEAARAVIRRESLVDVDLHDFPPSGWLGTWPGAASAEVGRPTGSLRYHHFQDVAAPLASGSFRTHGMVVCPCSSATLSAIVHGTGANLIHRAADVHLKERRPLILVPRETPLSLVQLENMKRACQAGAVILPAMPGFYHRPRSVADLVDFVVARICDHLEIPHSLVRRWGEPD